MFKNLFATHPIDAMPEVEAGEVVLGDAHGVHGDATLKRALTAKHLVMLGVGAVIGAGIFVLTGTAAAQFAGPALVVSFLMAGFACALAGLCYAEFSAMLPVSGSAYSYSYATLGEVVAWFVGWNLVLEYLFAASTVAVGWSGYFNELLRMLSGWAAARTDSAPHPTPRRPRSRTVPPLPCRTCASAAPRPRPALHRRRA